MEEEIRNLGVWVPPGHFYSPLVDPNDEFVDAAIREEAAPALGLDTFAIDAGVMWHWFGQMTDVYHRHPFAETQASQRLYYYGNPNFPLADALSLVTMVEQHRPKRFVEVGSGFSSCALLDHLSTASQDVQCTFIEPYPEQLPEKLLGDERFQRCHLKARLQAVPLRMFEELEAGDILFIDSSHVAKTGSDVLDYVFRILPALRPGVVVHIHDIFFPFDYPAAWIRDQNRSWNEAYLLRALLQGSTDWQVLFWFDWFFKCQRTELERAMPDCVPHRGGSIWLQKAQGPLSPGLRQPVRDSAR